MELGGKEVGLIHNKEVAQVEQDCRRCYGRKQVDGIDCFLCHGKGKREISPEQLDEYFSKFREETKKRRDQ